MTPPPLLHLNNNFKIPAFGLGTGKVSPKKKEKWNFVGSRPWIIFFYARNNIQQQQLRGALGIEAIKDAIDAGYRLFDTAFLYGNEDIVGFAVGDKIAAGVVARDEIFIVTKLWGIHHEQVEQACRDSCRRLNVDYIDLYLLHLPVSFTFYSDNEKWPKVEDVLDKDFMDVWREMEKLVKLGLVRAIGVCNFNGEQIQRLYDNATIKPSVHEMEFHPAYSRDELVSLCKNLNIQLISFCPLGRHKPENCQPKFLYDERVIEIAKNHQKSPAQIVLRYTVQCGLVPIPMSTAKLRIQENIEIFDFQLTDDEIKYLKTFHNDQNQICKFHFAEKSCHYPFLKTQI